MKLYWCPKTRAQRAVWMLEETGVPYELVTIDIRDENRQADPGFEAASPMGKVPALEDGEVAMAESAAICLYLADRYASGRLAPAIDDPKRGQYLYWMLFTPGSIEPAMVEKFSGLEPNRISHPWGDFATMMQTLEAGYGEGPWILGDEFSAADVMAGGSVVFMRQFGILPEASPLNAYADRCLARPGFEKARSLDQD